MKDEILVLLDRSGSMSNAAQATINGYNDFIKAQLELSDDCNVTTVLFDDNYEELYTSIPIREVPKLTFQTYYVRGMTALNDALGKLVDSAGIRFARQRVKPAKVIVQIFTDGQENASREYSADRIKSMVTHQESKYGWEFVYVGCDHNVKQAAWDLGFKSANTFQIDKVDLYAKGFMGATNNSTIAYRSSPTEDSGEPTLGYVGQ